MIETVIQVIETVIQVKQQQAFELVLLFSLYKLMGHKDNTQS